MPNNQPRRRHRPHSFWEKFWENDRGQTIIWQKPNIYLKTWAVCTVINIFLPIGWLDTILSYIGLIALIAWAALEVYSGVNYFRRVIGGLVLLILLFSRAFI